LKRAPDANPHRFSATSNARAPRGSARLAPIDAKPSIVAITARARSRGASSTRARRPSRRKAIAAGGADARGRA